MLVLVTGASGFVGSHITQTLLDEQIKVRVVSRSIKDTADIEWSNMAKIFITENLFKEPQENLCKLLEGVDIVIHAAWYAEPGKYLDSEKNLECLEGTLSLAKAASQVGVKKFVGIGTCLEYGESQERLNVDSPLDPISLYASSKAACYRELDKFCENIDMDFAWARLFYLYGAREDSRRLVPYLKRRLFEREIAEITNGDLIRDFMNVADAAKLIVNVACGHPTGALNICSGEPITIRELAISIAKRFNAEDCLRFGTRASQVSEPVCILGEPSIK